MMEVDSTIAARVYQLKPLYQVQTIIIGSRDFQIKKTQPKPVHAAYFLLNNAHQI